jgi:hypothetical protein
MQGLRYTYSLAAEADTLLRVEDGALSECKLIGYHNKRRNVTHLPHERLDAASTAIDLVKSDLADDFAAVLPTMRR